MQRNGGWHFVLWLSILTARFAAGATYYVAANGNDANDGSELKPWRTIAHVNQAALKPGDMVLFRRGDTWNEGLVVQHSGTATAPISFDAYGTGAHPSLDGLNRVAFLVHGSGASYVAVRNLALINAANCAVYVESGAHWTIAGNNIVNAVQFAVDITGISPAAVMDRNTYTTSANFDMAGSAISINAAVDSVTISNNTIELSHISRARHPGGIFTLGVNNAQIFGNRVNGGAQAIGVKAYRRAVSGIAIHDNLISNVEPLTAGDGESIELTGYSTSMTVANSSVYRNVIQGNSATAGGIDAVYTVNSTISYNIVLGPFNPSAAAMHWSSSCTGNEFYNNTLCNTEYGITVYSGSTATIINNIFAGMGRPIATEVSNSTTIEDYNLSFKSGASLLNAAPGAHDLTADPRFAAFPPASPTDVRLQAGSPAIDRGANLGTPFEWALDPRSVAMPFATVNQNLLGNGWELGAFAYREPAPVLASAPFATPNPAAAGQAVQFQAAARDGAGDGDTLLYTWTFGDGTVAHGSSVTHTYARPAAYTAAVTISDGHGGTISANIAVTVSNAVTAAPADSVPPADAAPLATTVLPELKVLKVAGIFHSSGSASDSCELIASVPATWNSSNRHIRIAIEDAAVNFDLNARNFSLTALGSIKATARGGSVLITMRLKGSFAGAWKQQWLTATGTHSRELNVAVEMLGNEYVCAPVAVHCAAAKSSIKFWH